MKLHVHVVYGVSYPSIVHAWCCARLLEEGFVQEAEVEKHRVEQVSGDGPKGSLIISPYPSPPPPSRFSVRPEQRGKGLV